MVTLVTGGTGFVGSSVVRQLLERGESVRALVRPNSDRRNLQGLDVELFEADLNDHPSLRAASSGVSSVYHVAADYRLWVRDAQAMHRTNVEGTVNLIRAACDAGARRIVYTSSVATLGIPKDGSLGDETTPVCFQDMMGPYKQSKYLAEEAVRTLIGQEGAPVIIVNPSTPIGPRDIKPTPTGRMVLDAARGRIPAFVDTGLNLVHVDDVAAGHLLAHDRGEIGQRYILGGENLSLREIFSVIAQLCRRQPPGLQLPAMAVLPIAIAMECLAALTGKPPLTTVDGVRLARKKMFFCHKHAEDKLGYRPRPAVQGVRDALTWFQTAGLLAQGEL